MQKKESKAGLPGLPEVKTLGRIMEALCAVCMAVGGAIVLTLPWSLRWYLDTRYGAHYTEGDGARLYGSMLLLLALSGVCAFCCLYHGRRILHNIAAQDPFTPDTSRRLLHIAAWCLPIGLAYLFGVALIPSAFVVMVGLAFLFLSVMMLILAGLFAQAADYKRENDLTI